MRYQPLQAKTQYSVEVIEYPSMVDRFMPEHVARFLIEYDVVLSYCIIHWCLVTELEYVTLSLNAIIALI